MCTTGRSGSCKEGYCHKQEWRPAGRHFLCCRGLFFFAMCILLQQGFSLFCKMVFLLGMFRLFRINRNNKTLQRCIEKLKQWVEKAGIDKKITCHQASYLWDDDDDRGSRLLYHLQVDGTRRCAYYVNLRQIC